MKKECLQCNRFFEKKTFEGFPYWNRKKYCSYKCKVIAQTGKKRTVIKKNCLICGNEIWQNRWQERNGRGKYCSKKCFFLDKVGKLRPDMIGNTFASGNIPWNKGKPWSKEIKKKLSNSHIGLSSWNKGKKLKPQSLETKLKKSLAQRGEKGSNWKGGITSENRTIRTSSEYQDWRKSVFERDDYTCQICGERGVYLRSNHIKKFSDYKDLRLEVNNGITICEKCDLTLVMYHEREWESYFSFNLINRGIV